MDINQIKMDYLSSKIPILTTVDDGGEVRIFFLDNLDRKPVCLSNDGVSTWGIAINKAGPIVGVGANSYEISVWNLSTATVGNEKTVFKGHKHNIPCIDFSPCGRYIASISIDSTARVWDLKTAKMLHKIRLGHEWGWSVKWIKRHTVKNISLLVPIWMSLKQRILQAFPAPLQPVLATDDDEDSDTEGSDIEGEDRDSDRDSEEEEGDEEEGGNEEEEGSGNVDDATEEQSDEELPDVHDQEVAAFMNELLEAKDRSEEHKTPSKKLKTQPSSASTEECDSDDLVLCATFRHLILCDSKLKPLATLYNAIPRPIIQVPPMMHQIIRLALIEYIPELSLVIIGSQGCACVLLVRIVKNVKTDTYTFFPGDVLPKVPEPSPISGMCVTRHISPVASLSYFKLYILYQNGTFFCYELRRSPNTNPIDLSSINL